MDWEPWHTRHNANRWMGRPGASAMPLVGMYGSFHEGVIRQHAIWLVEAGPVPRPSFPSSVTRERPPFPF